VTRYWRRTIDSAQRRIAVQSPDPQRPGLEEVVFEIQGIHIKERGKASFVAYHELAEMGIAKGAVKPLSMMARLMRQATPIGVVRMLEGEVVSIEPWSQPAFRIVLDMAGEHGQRTWRELDIMARSAGYRFLLPE